MEKKYPNRGRVHLDHPYETQVPPPQVISYTFPKELSWADLTELMGKFEEDKETNTRNVRICQNNISSVIGLLSEDKVFSRNFLTPMLALYKDDEDKGPVDHLTTIFTDMVIRRELGHMVFRSIRHSLSPSEYESLANWFTCLFVGTYSRELLFTLTKFQNEKYHDFVSIPQRYKLNRRSYQRYCNKLHKLLREW